MTRMPEHHERSRSGWGNSLRVVVFSSGAFLLLGFSAYASLSNGWNFATGAAASAVLLFFGHIDRFKSFKAGPSGGIEAELHDKVREATATIGELRSLARVLGEAVLWQASKIGRFWSSDTDAKMLDLQHQVFEIFDQLGLDEQAKVQASREIRRVTLGGFASALTGGSPGDMKDERLELCEGDPNPEKVRGFLQRAGQLDDASPELEELLTDFSHYYETGEHRRFSVFLDRQNWLKKYLREIQG